MDTISQGKGLTSVAIYRAFAVIPPLKFVGVIGNGRRYEWVITLRAVVTIDFMTRWAHLHYRAAGNCFIPYHVRRQHQAARDD